MFFIYLTVRFTLVLLIFCIHVSLSSCAVLLNLTAASTLCAPPGCSFFNNEIWIGRQAPTCDSGMGKERKRKRVILHWGEEKNEQFYNLKKDL